MVAAGMCARLPAMQPHAAVAEADTALARAPLRSKLDLACVEKLLDLGADQRGAAESLHSLLTTSPTRGWPFLHLEKSEKPSAFKAILQAFLSRGWDCLATLTAPGYGSPDYKASALALCSSGALTATMLQHLEQQRAAGKPLLVNVETDRWRQHVRSGGTTEAERVGDLLRAATQSNQQGGQRWLPLVRHAIAALAKLPDAQVLRIATVLADSRTALDPDALQRS